MIVKLLRGLPGSGKSTWVQKSIDRCDLQHKKTVICSADDFHTINGDFHTINGDYQYDPKRAGVAHSVCLSKYVTELTLDRCGLLIVDNTNTRCFEIAPYVALAIAYNADYEIVYLPCDPITAIKRNIHNVPASTILAMNTALLTDYLPPFWKLRVEC